MFSNDDLKLVSGELLLLGVSVVVSTGRFLCGCLGGGYSVFWFDISSYDHLRESVLVSQCAHRYVCGDLTRSDHGDILFTQTRTQTLKKKFIHTYFISPTLNRTHKSDHSPRWTHATRMAPAWYLAQGLS